MLGMAPSHVAHIILPNIKKRKKSRTNLIMAFEKDETMEHTVLRCPRARMIRRQAEGYLWEASTDPWLASFFAFFHQSVTDRTPMVNEQMAYIAYQIWLSRNSLAFDDEVISVRWVLD